MGPRPPLVALEIGLREGGLVVFLVGLILFAAAVAAAIIGIVQNRHLVIDVHALGQTWTVHAYWVLVAGVIVAVVGLLGLAIINRGAERSRRLRHERRALARENRRLSKLAADDRDDIASKRAANAYPAVDRRRRIGRCRPPRRARPSPTPITTSGVGGSPAVLRHSNRRNPAPAWPSS